MLNVRQPPFYSKKKSLILSYIATYNKQVFNKKMFLICKCGQRYIAAPL